MFMSDFPVKNDSFTCPKCGVDESGLDIAGLHALCGVCPVHGVRFIVQTDKVPDFKETCGKLWWDMPKTYLTVLRSVLVYTCHTQIHWTRRPTGEDWDRAKL
jgi:hypothetical protein